MEQVVDSLATNKNIRIFLFGAGQKESDTLEKWSSHHTNVENMAGKLQNMGEELALMSHFEVMLTMDSGNMHLASLAAIPVVSIWGATHPLGGFLGYGQKMDDVLQRTDLPCRPCSIYGNAPCKFGDYRCLTGIAPETVVKKVLGTLNIKN